MRAIILALFVIGGAMLYAKWQWIGDPGYKNGPDSRIIAALMDRNHAVNRKLDGGRAVALTREVTKIGCDPLDDTKVECRFRQRLIDPAGNQQSATNDARARFIFVNNQWVLVDH